VKRFVITTRSDFEYRAKTVRTACFSRAVEISISALYQWSVGGRTVARLETMQRCEFSARRYLEDCAVIGSRSATGGYSVKVPVGGKEQGRHRASAVYTIEIVKSQQSAVW
jgi:hypothetical protein